MNEKKYVSVICEYNPLHHGHLYQLNVFKDAFDGVICIMSGNVVQRGLVAVADKYIRAESALNCGADLVLELPFPWCCASATDFACAGVHIAENVGAHYLGFGAEDDISALEKINDLCQKSDFQQELFEKIENNKLSYPQGFSALVCEHLGEEYAKIVEKPNNILGMEYLRALNGKNILPFAVKRNLDFLSSTQIRSFESPDKIIEQLPDGSAEVYKKEMGKGFVRDEKKLDSFFIGTLRRMRTIGDIQANLYSTPDDLVKKLVANSIKTDKVSELVNLCVDKKYTQARVRRGLLALTFGITTDKVKQMPPYTLVLAANEKGREILKKAKKISKIPIITKPVHALEQGMEAKKAFEFSKGIEDIIALSSPIYEFADMGKTPKII